MRNFLIVTMLLSCCLANVSLAHPQLKDNMEQLDKLLRQIRAGTSDASKNATNAAAAGQMATLLRAAMSHTPDIVSAMPANQQTAPMANYQSLLDKAVTLATSLQTAFKNGDNAAAANLIKQIQESQRDGHDEYHPDRD